MDLRIVIFGCSGAQQSVELTFPDAAATAEFVATAFANCTFDDVDILQSASRPILDAIGHIADSVIVKGVLNYSKAISLFDSLDFVRKFRKVEVSLFAIFLMPIFDRFIKVFELVCLL